jgi:hypothetical protein
MAKLDSLTAYKLAKAQETLNARKAKSFGKAVNYNAFDAMELNDYGISSSMTAIDKQVLEALTKSVRPLTSIAKAVKQEREPARTKVSSRALLRRIDNLLEYIKASRGETYA